MTNRLKTKEKGSIMVYTLMILIIILVISIALTRLIIPKLKITNEAIYSEIAAYAADSGLELCLFSNRINPAGQTIPTLAQLTANYGITGISIQTIPNPCPFNGSVGFRAVGTYNGISRSLEIF